MDHDITALSSVFVKWCTVCGFLLIHVVLTVLCNRGGGLVLSHRLSSRYHFIFGSNLRGVFLVDGLYNVLYHDQYGMWLLQTQRIS